MLPLTVRLHCGKWDGEGIMSIMTLKGIMSIMTQKGIMSIMTAHKSNAGQCSLFEFVLMNEIYGHMSPSSLTHTQSNQT